MAEDTIRKILRQSDSSFEKGEAITVAIDRERNDISNMVSMVAINEPYAKFKSPNLIEISLPRNLSYLKRVKN